MRRSELEKEAKRRARKRALFALILPAAVGFASITRQHGDLCSYTGRLSAFQCASDLDYALAILVILLAITILIGLPLAYMKYNDTKWKLYGYSLPANGYISTILILGLYIWIITWFASESTRMWYEVIYCSAFFGLFVYELVTYYNLKQQYQNDKRRSKTPDMKLLKKTLKNEQIAAAKQAQEQKRQARKKKAEEDYYDDGL